VNSEGLYIKLAEKQLVRNLTTKITNKICRASTIKNLAHLADIEIRKPAY